MADRDSRETLTPTERAKMHERVPVGGAPPISMAGKPSGGILHRDAADIQRAQTQPPMMPQGPQGVPMAQAIKPPTPAVEEPQMRSPEEIKADLQSFSRGVQSMQAGQAPTPAEMESGPPPAPASPPPSSKEEEAEEEEDSWYQYGAEFNDRVTDVLNNEKRRKWIESRLKKMQVEDLIMYGEVHQEVEVLPGKLRITYRTTSGEEDLAVKKLMYSTESGSTRYIVDKFSLMNLTAGLYAVNDQVYPTHLTGDGDFDEQMFNIKYKKVLKMPMQLLADLVCNYIWFDSRVRNLLVPEELGNG